MNASFPSLSSVNPEEALQMSGRPLPMKAFRISLLFMSTLGYVTVPPVQALPLTGTFEVKFSQSLPSTVSSAGDGTFTAAAGTVTQYHFEFATPIPEEFEGPPLALTWDGVSLIGSDFAEYISGGFLQFADINGYEISVPFVSYVNFNLGGFGGFGGFCQSDARVGNCLASVGTYAVNRVPEPSSLALLAIGLAVTRLRLRSRNSSKARPSRH